MGMVVQLSFDLAAGLIRKERGQRRAEAKDRAFVEAARLLAIQHCRRHGSVTADDVRTLAASAGIEPRSKNSWGCIFRGAGWIKMGYRKSALASNHSHENPVWQWAPR